MLWRWLFGSREVPVRESRELFLRVRPDLERHFFAGAAASGKPRGLRWKSIEWEPETTFARLKSSGQLAALVGVIIAFEAIEGGEMEGVEAVSNLRLGSAEFFWHDGRWCTKYRVIFNLTPKDILARFADEFELLD